jgi:hypothetical protein
MAVVLPAPDSTSETIADRGAVGVRATRTERRWPADWVDGAGGRCWRTAAFGLLLDSASPAGSDLVEPAGSAPARGAAMVIAIPTPSATASAPTRPMWRAYPGAVPGQESRAKEPSRVDGRVRVDLPWRPEAELDPENSRSAVGGALRIPETSHSRAIGAAEV